MLYWDPKWKKVDNVFWYICEKFTSFQVKFLLFQNLVALGEMQFETLLISLKQYFLKCYPLTDSFFILLAICNTVNFPFCVCCMKPYV